MKGTTWMLLVLHMGLVLAAVLHAKPAPVQERAADPIPQREQSPEEPEKGPEEPDRMEGLKDAVSAILDRHPAVHYGFWYEDLQTGESLGINETEAFYPCCMIKLPVLFAVYQDIEQGLIEEDAHWTDLVDMITISDNTAMNHLVRDLGWGDPYLGMEKVNACIRSSGLEQTVMMHGLQPGEDFFGLYGSNLASAKDMGTLLKKLYLADGISQPRQASMLELLSGCLDSTAFGWAMPEGVRFAHKTGCAEDWYHDGGIVFSPEGDFVLCLFSQGEPETISQVGEQILSAVLDYRKEGCSW